MKQQVIKDNYAIYNADCMEVLPTLPENVADLVIYSPPFAGLYNYSSDARDFSNCDSKEEFLEQYDFLLKEMSRVTKPWRMNAVHCTDILTSTWAMRDFSHEIIKLHEKYWFEYMNRITISKEPMKVRIRTMVQSLMHKFIMEDSTKCFTAMPDYLLIFRKKWENKIPVTHKNGINEYAWEILILPHMTRIWNNANKTNLNDQQLTDFLQSQKDNEWITKLNHYIRQRYANSIRDDIRIDNVLPFRDSKEEGDEKHVHPLQLDVIDRIVELYSNPWEVVLTPFMGVGSEVFSPVSHGRKAIGIELKDSYFKQAIINLEHAEKRFEEKNKQTKLIW